MSVSKISLRIESKPGRLRCLFYGGFPDKFRPGNFYFNFYTIYPMKKVYQTIIDPGKGNCMQAAIASLWEFPLEEVPNFKEYDQEWFSKMWSFIGECSVDGQEYEILGTLYNPKGHHGFKGEDRFPEIKEMAGVKGYFYASVYSPIFYHPEAKDPCTHAVVIDKDYNIVHDVNKQNLEVKVYPEADKMGYNGILTILMIEPKS